MLYGSPVGYLFYILQYGVDVHPKLLTHRREIFPMTFLFLMRRNHSLSHSHINYTMKSKRRGEKTAAKNLPCPILSPSEFTLLLPLFSLSVIYPEMLVMLQLDFTCKEKNILPLLLLLTFPLQGLSSRLPCLSLCCECRGCQCHSLTWLVFLTPGSRRGARRAGGDAQPCIEVKGKKARPASSEAPWWQSSL